MNKYTTKDFDKDFPDDKTCLEWIKNHRWPNGIHCQTCKRITKYHRVKNRACYECDRCGTQVYPTANTIFHKSTTPLRTWFQVMYHMASTRSGISAKQIQRETGVTYKTAWRMCHQIRKLLNENISQMSGQIEADETYVGGKRHGKRGRGAAGKTIVGGLAQRKGKLAAIKIPNVRAATLMRLIKERVLPKSIIHTDDLPSYNRLVFCGYSHKRIHHQGTYVVGDIHTNTIDGFWSLFKRGVNGVYHAISSKYLQAYLNEYVFRYNHRKDKTPMFRIFLNRICRP